MTSPAPLVLGTAGHVDHGKTTLVKALTGCDTDRLAEERRRGLSIELGFAPLVLPSGRRLSIVDVPGHESFIRTMVAGATGVDMFLMCIAADDGLMPQTVEHAEVLRALGVGRGVVAITRADLANAAPAAEQARELLPGCATVAVAAPAGEGVEELVAEIERTAHVAAGARDATRPAVLHIDRSFTLRGHGTVVTGTLWSGTVTVGDRLLAQPAARPVRVRSAQVHDRPVERAVAGQRVALGLAGASWRELARGDALCGEDAALAPAYRVHVRLRLAASDRPLEHGERVHVHHGTRHTTGRAVPVDGEAIEPSTEALCQLRCQDALIAGVGDRVVVRRVAARTTVAGATVVEDPRGGARESPPRESVKPRPESLPLDEIARRIAAMLHADGARPRSDGDLRTALGLEQEDLVRRLRMLEEHGEVVRVGRDLHFHCEPLEALTGQVLGLFDRHDELTIALVRDELDTSRRYALALLEHFDSKGLTVRHGDRRVLRRRGRERASRP